MRLEQLTAEMAWIRRLAFALVRDDSVADDVAQDTWLAAAGKVPSDRPIRPWLSRVVTNIVRMRARSTKRREATEGAAVTDGAVPTEASVDSATADDLIDRVELQRAIVDAVLALAEPYRSTVLLHFFEGLSSAEIARRLGVPGSTVRGRLHTSLDQLRARLKDRYRKRGGLAALVPIAAAPSGSSDLLAAGAGEIAMKKIGIGVVVLAIVVGSVWWWRSRETEAPTKNAPAVATKSAGGATAHASVAPSTPLAATPWFVQPGVKQRRVAGKVLFRGEPLAGAIVRLGSSMTDPPHEEKTGDELAQLVTGADGAFDFGMQPAATFIVSAEAQDKTPVSRAIAAADPDSKADEIVLELGMCRSRVFGQVVDASGGGIAKARLRVQGLGGADADASGNYSLCVPVGDSQIRVDADGYGAIHRPLHLVGELKQNFELVPEAVLAGSVVDERGAAVPFARVIALPQAIEQPHFLGDGHTTADAEGKFRISNVPPGRFLLAASADGFGTTTAKAAVAAPGANQDITIVVEKRARVTGRVMMDGKPVAGARVMIATPDLSKRASYSQADGAFSLDGVPQGAHRLVAGAYKVVSPKELVVKGRSLDDVTIEVEQLPSLHGTITRHGKPVADAIVQTSIGPQARSDGKGHYEIRGLPPGELQVTVQVYGAISAFAPWQKVAITQGADVEKDIELTGGAEVHGVVVNAQGEPVPHVYVRMIEPKGDLGESMTDDQGRFRCTSMLGGGAYRVAVFPSPGSRVAFAPATPPAMEIDVADGETIIKDVKVAIAHDVMSIGGRVVDDGGAPVADVHVEAISRGTFAFPFAVLPSIRADASGHFTIDNLAKGHYTLHAHAGDGSEAEILDVEAGRQDVVIKVIRPGAIEGTIANFTSPPRVHARQLTAELQLGNDAVLEGNSFSITGLAPGRYVVEALAGDENAGQSVEVKSGAVTKVKLESKGKGFVEGTVTDFTTKQPLAGFSCVAAQSMGGQSGDWANAPATPENTTDAKGAFKIPAPIGKARVMCFYSDNTYSVAGGDADVSAAGGKIELKSVKAEPPPSDPGFRIKPLTLPLVIAVVDASGPAKAAGLQIGDKLVTIDGAPVNGLLPGGAMMLAWNKKPGAKLVLGVDRGGVTKTIEIVPVKATN
ncbi:MAG: sigma-70 family RNA polymerase sigma factor [Kofleriaceae bacterium]